MEHLIKTYSCVRGKGFYLKRIFPNFLFCFHQLNLFAQQYLLPAFPVNFENQQNKISVGFFLRCN
jgi:hypothetical protein